MTTATLTGQTGRKKRPEPSAEANAAVELVRIAKEQGLSLTGSDAAGVRSPALGWPLVITV
ncbi:hypothetical protein [Micromonospora sp. D75]|uniref:hypothetical protein n=1 Tax=Micromonospora TaxID=1873 RepID=UPI001FFC59F4|nr:hypothetical protein [Micromonospora sp. D75]